MTAGRGPRHAGRKGGAPVRKSITTRYFYSTAVLLICSIAVMGFIQMYLAMGYFREENGTALIQTIDNAILAMQEAADDGIVEKRAEAAEAAGLDVDAFDALKLAEEAGSAKAVNIVLMGHLSNYFDFPLDDWMQAIGQSVPARFLELNQKAFTLGRNS